MRNLLFLSLLMSLIFLGCEPKGSDYSGLIAGTWVNTEVDSVAILTDASYVMEFRTGGVQMYAVGTLLDAESKTWKEDEKFKYRMNGKEIIIDGTSGQNNGAFHMELEILALNDSLLTYSVTKMSLDKVEYPDAKIYTCRKVTTDYRKQFTGIWHGRCTSMDTADTGDHYWEYFPDGRFSYYYQDKTGKWLVDSSTESRYFLYGNMLVSNYQDVDMENGSKKTYDCWNIQLTGDTLTIKSLRENSATVTYRMEKVASAPTVE